MLNIAHRGASGSQPENTKSSFLEAIKLGADIIELDVNVTKDKQIVVIHDSTIDRTSNGKGKVSEYTLNELKKFDFGFGYRNEKILTLTEALNLIGNKSGVLIELKESIKGHENKVIEVLKKAKNTNILVHSSYFSIIKNCYKIDQSVKLGYVFSYSSFRFLTRYYLCYFLKRYHLSFISFEKHFIHEHFIRKLIQKLHDKRMQVYVWTVNDLNSVHQATSLDVDGIITNYPGKILF